MKKFFYLLKEGIKHIWNNKMMAVASICVLIFGLLLTGAVYLISLNVEELVESVGEKNVVKVYLNDEVTEQEAQYIGEEILAVGNISNCEFVSKEEAFKSFDDLLGDAYTKFEGDQNPLPHAFNITLTDLNLYDETIARVANISGVQKTSDQREVAEMLTGIQSVVNMFGFWATLILGIISLFIISNTIRITMYARRFEISIMKSVGATNTFVRTPFLIEAMIIGIISGGVAASLLLVLYDSIMETLRSFSVLQDIGSINYPNMTFYIYGIYILAGMLIGMIAANISIGKYLKREGNQVLRW